MQGPLDRPDVVSQTTGGCSVNPWDVYIWQGGPTWAFPICDVVDDDATPCFNLPPSINTWGFHSSSTSLYPPFSFFFLSYIRFSFPSCLC